MSCRCRRLSRITNFAVCAPTRVARRGDGNSGTLAAPELDQLVDRPHPLHRAHDRRQHRSLDAHREVDARRLLPRRVHVVDDVDAADEGDAPVDVAELAVQPPQPVRAELPGRDLRPVHEQLDARPRVSVCLDRGRQVVLGAPAVDQHPDLHAALRRAHQRLGDVAARLVVGVDVGLEPDLALGVLDRRRPAPGKYSPPLRSSATRLPGVKRFIVRAWASRRSRPAPRDRTAAPVETRSGRARRRWRGRGRRCGRGGTSAAPRETCARAALDGLEHLVDPELVDQHPVRLVPPVVEVAGDHQRRVLGHRGARCARTARAAATAARARTGRGGR